MTTNDRSLYARTLANGGGTFEMHADNFERRDITSGFSVGMVRDTKYIVDANDVRVFNMQIANVIRDYPEADALGTWLHEGRIYIDPVRIFAQWDDALTFAIANRQIAFYDLDNGVEVTTDHADFIGGEEY